MSVTLRLYDGAGTFQSTLPFVGDISIMDTLNEEGSATLSYHATGTGALALLGIPDGSVGVHINGQEVFEFLADDDEDDEASDEGNARTVQIAGQGTLGYLARGIVLPEDGIGAIPAIHPFTNASPGTIMLTLLTKMQQRGYLTNITPSFTATHDSAGLPWDVWVDIEYDAGKDLLTVVKDLAAQGACDVRMVRRRLDLYRPNTSLAVDRPGIYVRRAHAESASRKRSKRNLRTDYLVVGDEGINMLRFDQAARDVYGRRIGFVGQGNTVSSSTLTRIGDESLKQNARPTRSYTIGLRPEHPSCPKPYVDFQLGDFIRCDFVYSEDADLPDGTYEPLRVRSISTTFGTDGVMSTSLELNDRFLEAIVDLARRVEGIRHGSVSTSSAPPSTGTPGPDTSVPAAPVTIEVQPRTTYSAEGVKSGTMLVKWAPVTSNDDGTPATDVAHYEVRYRLLDQEFSGEGAQYIVAGSTQTTSILLTGLPIRQRITIEIRTVDTSGNPSAWFVSAEMFTPMGDAPPDDPTVPTLTAQLGGVLVQWDRQTVGGGQAPPDMSEVEVHAGPTDTFAVSTTTQVGSMIGGRAFIAGLPHGVRIYIRLRIRDFTGNYSAPGGAASIIPLPVTADWNPNWVVPGAQITPGTVGTDKLTVGVLSDGMLLNGGFEELLDSGGPVGWVASAGTRFTGSTIAVTSTLPKQGSRALVMTVAASNEAEAICVPYYPLAANGHYYVAGYVKGSASVGQAQVGIYWYDSSKTLLSYSGNFPVSLSGAWVLSEQVHPVPANAAYGRVAVTALLGTGGTQVFADGMDLRLATGEAQILNASISRAKIQELAVDRARIANLAVGDAQIGNMNVSKLLAGDLTAQYVVVRGRLTSKADATQQGARWELDPSGFRAYDAAGNANVNIGSDGNAYFAGTIGAGAIISSPQITGGTITGVKFQTSSSGPRIELRELSAAAGQYANTIVFYGDYESEPVTMNVRTRNSLTLKVPDPLSTNQANIWMDPDRIKFDVSSGAGYNSIEVWGNRLTTNQIQATGISSSGGVSGNGIYDRGYLCYSPLNPPPSGSHSHDGVYAWWNHTHSGSTTAESANNLNNRSSSPAGTWTMLYDAIGHLQFRYGGATRAVLQPSTTSKTFVIDHPTDPHRFLQHAVIEGPTTDVFYRGKGRLETDAWPPRLDHSARVPRAVITLPAYFEDLAEVDGRTVLVTPIAGPCDVDGCDAFLPPGMAAGPVIDGQFTVYGLAGYDHDHAWFYWEVKAVRRGCAFDPEPARADWTLHGDGPYTYLRPVDSAT